MGGRPLLLASLSALALLACHRTPTASGERPPLAPLRGVVLISIDALRADALGLYGSRRPTSPFLDRLAERSLVFEHAYAQIPSTLPSHLSMFTGLYPSEHGVFPPSDVLAASIPTLPELFRAAGFRTFGHSEGGYVQGGYGFRRGFEEWTDTPYAAEADVERTFARGAASLEALAADERFFLFLHTYSVHDPYDPPSAYRDRFWSGPPPPGAFAATGPNFAAYNGRRLDAPAAAAEYYRALYDAGVAYVDDVLGRFFGELERLGLADDTLVIVTSDHGEEFLEHGRYVHTQAYPESLHIPLLVADARLARGRRVARVVETVDLLPTLADLAGLQAPAGLSGESVADLWHGGDGRLAGHALAQGEMLELAVRTLFAPAGGRLHQLLTTRAVAERDGFWVRREIAFDAEPPTLSFRAAAYHEPREVEVVAAGATLARLTVGTEWGAFRVDLPAGGKRVVTLRTPRCDSPFDLGLGADSRCLSFKLDGLALRRLELFDLGVDPRAARDLSGERSDLVRALVPILKRYPETARAAAGETALTDEQIRQLKALGYLQ
ncbi:MAG: sulfatase [Thermoanaerobaculia bacterium]|nr:sulfatase [Thermoanaerobaculia bacterium]